MTTSTKESPATRRGALHVHELAALRLRDGVTFARGELERDGHVNELTWKELDDRMLDLIDTLENDEPLTRATSPSRGPLPYRWHEARR